MKNATLFEGITPGVSEVTTLEMWRAMEPRRIVRLLNRKVLEVEKVEKVEAELKHIKTRHFGAFVTCVLVLKKNLRCLLL